MAYLTDDQASDLRDFTFIIDDELVKIPKYLLNLQSQILAEYPLYSIRPNYSLGCVTVLCEFCRGNDINGLLHAQIIPELITMSDHWDVYGLKEVVKAAELVNAFMNLNVQ